MPLWKLISGQFIDVIEWLDSSRDAIVHRFERQDNEIKYGAKLIVREGQVAIFVNEGRLADVFPAGTFTLETRNLPILSTLLAWKHGFESPVKAEVYFVNTRPFTDLKWGTKNPVLLRDADFGLVRLRAFGTFAIRVIDAATFLREVVGTNHRFVVEDVASQLRDLIVARFADILGESKIPAAELAAGYDELGKFVRDRISADFEAFGVEVSRLVVENVSLPPEVEKAVDARASMGAISNLDAYAKFRAAEAMGDAARNPGGAAAQGMGLGMGIGMAGAMGAALGAGGAAGGSGGASGAAGPPPLPGPAAPWFAAIAGAQAGPFDLDAMRSRAGTGEVTRDSLVWRQGMAEWRRAGDLPELASIFAGPPPLPPGL